MLSTQANEAFNEDRYEDSFAMHTTLAKNPKDKDALYMLGRHYMDGLGVEANYDKAISLRKRTAEAGSIDAQYALLERNQTTSKCCKG
ncbi:MAG TPA: hypothetical protein ENN12_05755 [Epsilonproteobacteria bacterium]|nr:hypothetical protein [Campylobacterota bacterium]